MSSFVVHFPDGSREFRYPAHPLKEGDVISHNGDRYRVISIQSQDERTQSVTLELDSDELGDVLHSERGGIVLELLGSN
jgi:hypothetical protein